MDFVHPDQLECWVGPWIGPTPWRSYLHEPELIYELESKFEQQYPHHLRKDLAKKLKLGNKEKKEMKLEKAKTIANELIYPSFAHQIIHEYFGDPSCFSTGDWKNGFVCNPPTLVLQIINYLKTLNFFNDFIILAKKKNRGILLGRIDREHDFLIARWGEDLLRRPTFTDLHRTILLKHINNQTGINGIPYPIWNYLWKITREQKALYNFEIRYATSIPLFWNNQHCGTNRYKIDFGLGSEPTYICPKCGIYSGGPKNFQPNAIELMKEPVAISEFNNYLNDLEERKAQQQLNKFAQQFSRKDILFPDENDKPLE